MKIDFTKKIALSFGTLLLAAGINTATAQVGAALNFDATALGDKVALPQAIGTNSLVGGTKITIEAWVKPTSLTGLGTVVGNYGTPNNQMQFLLRRENNYYGFWVGQGNNTSYQNVSSPAASATLNTWQHVAGVYNGTVLTIYINGAFTASASIINYTFAATTNSIGVGTGNINAESFNGEIDELRIWNTNRTQCEINTFMNCEIPTNAPNLVANYHFNQGTAAANNAAVTTLNDATSNAFNGTLNNFALTGATGNWVTPGGVVSGFTTALAPLTLTISANASLATCLNNTIALTASGASTYSWTGGVTNAVAFTATASTAYTVSATAVTGCTATSVANVSTTACPGAALNFDGTSTGDKVNLPTALSTNSLVGGTKITVEAWVKPTSLTGLGTIVGNYGTPNNQMQFLLRRENNYYGFWVGNSSAYQGLASPAASATLNAWQHVAGVYNGTVLTIYINGAFTASASITSYTFAAGTNSFVVGSGNAAEYFNGEIDELRIWNTNRSKCEINTFMNCEIPSNATNLITNYHFNHGLAFSPNSTVTTLTDATSNAFNGTLANIALTGIISNWVYPGSIASGFTTSLAPPSFTNSALAICPNGTVILGSTGATTYTWNPTITNNLAFTPTASTSYSYAGTNSVSSCSVTSIANVTVNSNPTVTAVSSETNVICDGQSATLTASGATSYTWNTSANTAVIAISPTVTTTYTVTGSNSDGCTNMTTVTQNVSPCTGLNSSNVSELALEIYPNPSNGIYNLKVSTEMNIQVFDVLGNSVLNTNVQSGDYKLSLSEFSKGMYIVKCSTQNQVETYRLIKN